MKPKAKKTRQARKAPDAARSLDLPAHWPRFTTPDYYAWMMAQMPVGAIPADWSRHQPHNSYSPLFWYEDKPQTCVDCGLAFVFTKEEQRAWYEDYRIPIFAMASRCAACRRQRRQARVSQREHMQEMARREPHPHEDFFRLRRA